jgi:hypothetical protein
MRFEFNDGGRLASGFKGTAGDCVTRAIAIATGKPYREVYDAMASGNAKARGKNSARQGIPRSVYHPYLIALGFSWVPTMTIGSGCKVHLADGELPNGRLIVRVSKHLTAVIDGVIFDTFNPQRTVHHYSDGIMTHTSERCVYGYFTMRGGEKNENANS